jgi:hypothetical protein
MGVRLVKLRAVNNLGSAHGPLVAGASTCGSLGQRHGLEGQVRLVGALQVASQPSFRASLNGSNSR